LGGIAGVAVNVTFTDCHVSGNITGTTPWGVFAGGIAGDMVDSTSIITRSSFTGNLSGGQATASAAIVGGIAGNMEGKITACFAEGRITAVGAPSIDDVYAGGIVGRGSGPGDITQSYAVGIIKSECTVSGLAYSYSGGIAGFAYSVTIEDCYARAYVSTNSSSNPTYAEYGGGVAGSNDGISRCYALGTVKSEGSNARVYLGGITGSANSVSDCMALVSEIDAGTSSASPKLAYAVSCANTGLTGNYALLVSGSPGTGVYIQNNTNSADPGPNNKDGQATPLANFQNSALYGTAGWDFSEVWMWPPSDWNYDYPVLKWQTRAPADPAGLAS
jgi:hypothetical protein